MSDQMRYIEELLCREESPWCKGEIGRSHVAEEQRTAYGSRMVCRHCGQVLKVHIQTTDG